MPTLDSPDPRLSSRARAGLDPEAKKTAKESRAKPSTQAPKKQRSLRVLAREGWQMLIGHRARLALSLGIMSLSTLIALIPPVGTKFAIDYIFTDHPGPKGVPPELGLPSDPVQLLYALVAAMLVVAAVQAVLQTFANWEIVRIQKRVSADLRRRAFDHAVRLPLHEAQKLRSGGVASLLRQDAGVIGDLIGSVITGPWHALIKLTGTLFILVAVDPLLMAGALLLLPIVVVTHRSWISRIRPLWRQIRAERQAVDAATTEVFSGLRVVRAFSKERTEARRFVVGNHAMLRREIGAWWRMRAVRAVWALLVPAATMLLLLYGGQRVIRGELSLGDLMMFTTYLLMLLAPIQALVSTATQVQNGIAGLDRVLELLSLPVEASANNKPLNNVAGALTFDHVSFTYPGTDRPVLTDINLEVAAGETIALVGPSGAGKTTLTHLVARFYAPSAGTLLLDGVPVQEHDLLRYRRLLAVVEQDVFLFDGSVAENIAYGQPRASIKQIRAAADRAAALEFIDDLEQGFETLIGERGVRLSGGQRQRLAIARALLADPKLLILDEATSNLDAESEARIQTGLKELLNGRTCFIIAHRLSTVRSADRVVVIDGGRLLEVGTHEELLAAKGRYSELLAAQMQDGSARPTLKLAPTLDAVS